VTILIRCMLFLSSYFPLALIIWILFFEERPLLAWVSLGMGLLGLIGMFVYFLGFAPRMSPIREKVTSRHARGGEVMGYVASYIIPFVTLPLSGWQQIASFVIFVFILGVVYVNSEDMIRVNPMLNLLLGYRLYEVTLEHGEDSYALITRRRIKRGDTVSLVTVGSGIFLEK